MKTWQRVLVFVAIFGGGLAILVVLTLVLISNAINTRSKSVALTTDVTVKEFVDLPDNDSYPAAVAVAPNGTVYTGSYKTGVMWAIDPSGHISEVPGSRDAIGAVTGLTVAPDGTVYIVDQNDADPNTTGGNIKKLTTDGKITTFAASPDASGFVSPDDITVDGSGNVYVSDRGRATVFRFAPDGSGATAWWTPPTLDGVTVYQPTGLAYDATKNAILVTDGVVNTIYSVGVADGKSDLLYRHGNQANPPGFDGITVTPQGTIYVAALGQDGIARLDGSTLAYIAGLFRSSSDVDYSAVNNRLYVTNFDSAPLAIAELSPHLPFSIDEVDLSPAH